MTKQQEQAYQDWKKGIKRADIAKKYGVAPETVKSWITRHFKSACEAEAGAPEIDRVRKQGAPKNNKNNLKHGAYNGFFADLLSEEELEVMNDSEPDIKSKLTEEMNILTIREKRLLIQIAKYQGNYKFDDDNINVMTGIIRIARDKGGATEKEVIKDKAAVYLYLKVLEEQLTKVQMAKAKIVVELAKLKETEKNPENNGGIIINFSGENELED